MPYDPHDNGGGSWPVHIFDNVAMTLVVAMSVAMGVAVVVAVTMVIMTVVLVQEGSADEVEPETHGSHNENQFRIFNHLQRNEALNGLEENANAQGEQEDAIEKGTKQASSLPSKREILWRHAPLRDDYGCQSHDEANQVIHIMESIGHESQASCLEGNCKLGNKKRKRDDDGYRKPMLGPKLEGRFFGRHVDEKGALGASADEEAAIP